MFPTEESPQSSIFLVQQSIAGRMSALNPFSKPRKKSSEQKQAKKSFDPEIVKKNMEQMKEELVDLLDMAEVTKTEMNVRHNEIMGMVREASSASTSNQCLLIEQINTKNLALRESIECLNKQSKAIKMLQKDQKAISTFDGSSSKES